MGNVFPSTKMLTGGGLMDPTLPPFILLFPLARSQLGDARLCGLVGEGSPGLNERKRPQNSVVVSRKSHQPHC